MAVQEPPVKPSQESKSSAPVNQAQQPVAGYVLIGVIVLLFLSGGLPVRFNPLFFLYVHCLPYPLQHIPLLFPALESAIVYLVAKKFGITPAIGLQDSWANMVDHMVLGKAQVIDRWSTLLTGANDLSKELIDQTKQLIVESGVPDVGMSEEKVSAGILQSLTGIKKDFLVIFNSTNSRLKPFRMYLSARNYGHNVQVSWYVAHQPSIFRRLVNLMMYVPLINLLVLPFKLLTTRDNPLTGLDLFDEEDLRAYVTNAHHCMLEALNSLGKEKNIDTSRVNRNSQGFLGIS